MTNEEFNYLMVQMVHQFENELTEYFKSLPINYAPMCEQMVVSANGRKVNLIVVKKLKDKPAICVAMSYMNSKKFIARYVIFTGTIDKLV